MRICFTGTGARIKHYNIFTADVPPVVWVKVKENPFAWVSRVNKYCTRGREYRVLLIAYTFAYKITVR